MVVHENQTSWVAFEAAGGSFEAINHPIEPKHAKSVRKRSSASSFTGAPSSSRSTSARLQSDGGNSARPPLSSAPSPSRSTRSKHSVSESQAVALQKAANISSRNPESSKGSKKSPSSASRTKSSSSGEAGRKKSERSRSTSRPSHSLSPTKPTVTVSRPVSRSRAEPSERHMKAAIERASPKGLGDKKEGRRSQRAYQSSTESSSSGTAEGRRERGRSLEAREHAERRRDRSTADAAKSSERGVRHKSRSDLRSLERGRSTSRATGMDAQPQVKSRAASLSRPAPSTNRGRSGSRSRPPATSARSRSIQHRSRSRSASLTRVTSPHGRPLQHHRPPPPPSTMRTRRELKQRTRSKSVSCEYRTQGRLGTDDGSTSSTVDANIGRNISFDNDMCVQSSLRSKKGGLMERLFGDSFSKQNAFRDVPGNVTYDIRPRILLAATVYQNTATNLWITTINTNQRGVAKNPALANKFLKAFSFPTEQEARESAIANAPPKMVPFNESYSCFNCRSRFAVFRRASHCRNCGVCVCNSCTTSWPARMIPATYNLKNEGAVKVCLSCDSLSTSFKRALLEGDFEEVISLYGTGNVNLRTPFPALNKKDEVMYPVHCAVEGGSLDILRWLVDERFCPIRKVGTGSGKKSKGADAPILTSKGRSVLSIAMENVRVEIMQYLVVECGVTVYETVDLKFALRALDAALSSLPQSTYSSRRRCSPHASAPRWDNASFDDLSVPSSLGVDEAGAMDDVGTVGSSSHWTKNSRTTDSCIICCDRKINCVATPCGHQVCCLECSTNLTTCPVCNSRGEFIKIFRP